MKNIKAFEEFNSAKISESKDDLIQAIKDIRAWVEDERDSKKYKGLLSNIDYALKLAGEVRESNLYSVSEAKKITMNNLDWGKSTAERNANLDKHNSLKTDKEKNDFLKKLKGESVVNESNDSEAIKNLKAMKQNKEIKDWTVSSKGLITIELNDKTLISFTNNDDFKILHWAFR